MEDTSEDISDYNPIDDCDISRSVNGADNNRVIRSNEDKHTEDATVVGTVLTTGGSTGLSIQRIRLIKTISMTSLYICMVSIDILL